MPDIVLSERSSRPACAACCRSRPPPALCHPARPRQRRRLIPSDRSSSACPTRRVRRRPRGAAPPRPCADGPAGVRRPADARPGAPGAAPGRTARCCATSASPTASRSASGAGPTSGAALRWIATRRTFSGRRPGDAADDQPRAPATDAHDRRRPPCPPRLTLTERRVLQLVATGRSNADIAPTSTSPWRRCASTSSTPTASWACTAGWPPSSRSEAVLPGAVRAGGAGGRNTPEGEYPAAPAGSVHSRTTPPLRPERHRHDLTSSHPRGAALPASSSLPLLVTGAKPPLARGGRSARAAATGDQPTTSRPPRRPWTVATHRRPHDLDRDCAAPAPSRRIDVPRLHVPGGVRRRERGPAPTTGRRDRGGGHRGPRRAGRSTSRRPDAPSTPTSPRRWRASRTVKTSDPGCASARRPPPRLHRGRADDGTSTRPGPLQGRPAWASGSPLAPATGVHGAGLARLPQAGRGRRAGRARRPRPADEPRLRHRLQRGGRPRLRDVHHAHAGADRHRAVLQRCRPSTCGLPPRGLRRARGRARWGCCPPRGCSPAWTPPS